MTSCKFASGHHQKNKIDSPVLELRIVYKAYSAFVSSSLTAYMAIPIDWYGSKKYTVSAAGVGDTNTGTAEQPDPNLGVFTRNYNIKDTIEV